MVVLNEVGNSIRLTIWWLYDDEAQPTTHVKIVDEAHREVIRDRYYPGHLNVDYAVNGV